MRPHHKLETQAILQSTILPVVIVELILTYSTHYTEEDAEIQTQIQIELTEQLEYAEQYSLLYIRINEFFPYNYYWFDQTNEENTYPCPYLHIDSEPEDHTDHYLNWPGEI